MADIDVRRTTDPAPASSDPLLALIVASGCVATLLCVLTEHFATASAAIAAYTVAWLLVRS